jgi:uncharacterized repeat protein (TIGR01451 family)
MHFRTGVVIAIWALLPLASASADVLYADVPVSVEGTNNTIRYPNTSRNVAVSDDGIIHVLFTDRSTGNIYVATSTDRGASFETPVAVYEPPAKPPLAPADKEVIARGMPDPEPEIAVDASGVVHVIFYDPNTVHPMYTRSTDAGATFSTPVEIGTTMDTSYHIATDDPYVYIINKSGTTLYVNDDNGNGSFTTTSVDSSRVYADVHVDPATGDVFVQTDDPTVRVFKSTDHGASFGGAQSPGGSIQHSTTVLASTGDGVFLYTSGSGTAALRIDTSDYSQTALTFGSTTDSRGRTLAVDAYSNVIDGYVDGSSVKYAISTDNGETFSDPVTIATVAVGPPMATTDDDSVLARSLPDIFLSLAINDRYGDIVAVYEVGGQIFCTVYGSEIEQPAVLPEVTTTSITAVTHEAATGGGNVTYDGRDTGTTRGICWNTTGSPTVADSKTADGTGAGSFTSALTGLEAETTYFVRAYATNSAGTAYGSEVSFTTAADPTPAVPDLQIAVESDDTELRVGQEMRARVSVRNAGTGAATNVGITIPIPPGTEYVNAWLVGGATAQSTPLDGMVDGDSVYFDMGDVDAGADMLIELVLRALVAGTVEISAAATSNETPTPVGASVTAQANVEDEYISVTTSYTPLCGPLGMMPLVFMFGLLGMKCHRRIGAVRRRG